MSNETENVYLSTPLGDFVKEISDDWSVPLRFLLPCHSDSAGSDAFDEWHKTMVRETIEGVL